MGTALHLHSSQRIRSTDLVYTTSNIYTYASDCNISSKYLYRLAPSNSDYSVGALAWGRGASSSFLFASSEPKGDEISGIHRAVDVTRQKFVYTLSAKEAGDAIAVDDDGTNIHP